jgi:hypothetical protein
MRKRTASATTFGGSAMCESFSRIIQDGNFATGCAKFSKKFMPRLRDDWVAHASRVMLILRFRWIPIYADFKSKIRSAVRGIVVTRREFSKQGAKRKTRDRGKLICVNLRNLWTTNLIIQKKWFRRCTRNSLSQRPQYSSPSSSLGGATRSSTA